MARAAIAAQLGILGLLVNTVESVHISRLGAPSVVLDGEELILDCDFDYQEEEREQLDLKWYFNSSPFPIYQWVPSMHKGPQVIGDLFKGNLDLLYTAHNDTFKKHRALHILRPDHRFSGTYMCKVSSFLDEDFQQKDVLVIAAPERIVLEPVISRQDPAILNVTCRVERIYPTPAVALSWTVNSTTSPLTDTETAVVAGPTGLLTVAVSALLPHRQLRPEGVIGCEVTIPNTNFYVREELELYQYQNLKSWYTSAGACLSPVLVLVLVMVGQGFTRA